MTNLADEPERLTRPIIRLQHRTPLEVFNIMCDRIRLSALRGEPCRECQAVSAAIGSGEFMDPPDGGDVPLSEQVRRMRAALDDLRGEWQGIETARDALERAEQFIENGVELGFIRLPDADVNDPAHDTLPAIRKALRSLPPPPTKGTSHE